MLLASLLLVLLNSCPKEEEEPMELTLISLMADNVDLLASTTPNNVPANTKIKATFSTNVDPLTVTEADITLAQDYDDSNLDLTMTVIGPTITITPSETLATGALYQLSFGTGLMSTHDQSIGAQTKSFTTAGTFAPGGAIAHWTFEENADDVIGNYDPSPDGIVAITYTDSRNAAAGKAATFDGTNSIIEIPNGDQLINTENFTLSFWFKTNSVNHGEWDGLPRGHYIIGLSIWFGLFFEIGPSGSGYECAGGCFAFEDSVGNLINSCMYVVPNDNCNGVNGCNYVKNINYGQVIALHKDNWLQVVYTYNSNTKEFILYYNGEKMKSYDFDLCPIDDPSSNIVGIKYLPWEGEDNVLTFGFIHSRASSLNEGEGWEWANYYYPLSYHFEGQLDDVRIYHKTLTPTEVNLMYEAEKP